MSYTGNNGEPTVLVYPKYMTEAAYVNRKFTLNVLEHQFFTSTSDAVSQVKGTRTKKSTGSTSTKVPTTKEMNRNLKNNAFDPGTHTIFTFVLPLPNTFAETQSHTWNTDTSYLGTLGQELYKTSLGSVGEGMGYLGKKGRLTKYLEAEDAGRIRKKANLASKVLSKLGGGKYTLGEALGQASNFVGMRKPLMSPGYFQNYTGSTPREFNFSFDLIPNSAEEAKTIVDIIMNLKRYSSPSTPDGYGITLWAPHYFDIEVANEYVSGMANLHGVVLKTITVDYGQDGNMQFLPDGVPKYIKIDLTFAERRMATANDYIQDSVLTKY